MPRSSAPTTHPTTTRETPTTTQFVRPATDEERSQERLRRVEAENAEQERLQLQDRVWQLEARNLALERRVDSMGDALARQSVLLTTGTVVPSGAVVLPGAAVLPAFAVPSGGAAVPGSELLWLDDSKVSKLIREYHDETLPADQQFRFLAEPFSSPHNKEVRRKLTKYIEDLANVRITPAALKSKICSFHGNRCTRLRTTEEKAARKRRSDRRANRKKANSERRLREYRKHAAELSAYPNAEVLLARVDCMSDEETDIDQPTTGTKYVTAKVPKWRNRQATDLIRTLDGYRPSKDSHPGQLERRYIDVDVPMPDDARTALMDWIVHE